MKGLTDKYVCKTMIGLSPNKLKLRKHGHVFGDHVFSTQEFKFIKDKPAFSRWNGLCTVPHLPVPYIFGTKLPVANVSGNYPWFQMFIWNWKMRVWHPPHTTYFIYMSDNLYTELWHNVSQLASLSGGR